MEGEGRNSNHWSQRRKQCVTQIKLKCRGTGNTYKKYTDSLGNLEKMNTFLDIYDLLKQNQEDTKATKWMYNEQTD